MRTLVAILCALAATGCGVSGDEAEVRDVTERFYEAVRGDDGGAACELLSAEAAKALEGQTGQKCDDVITRLEYEGGDVEGVVVYVTNAKAETSAGESTFLSEEPDGWRIVAVACRPETGKPRDRPFECEVEA
jgi:hypothetical protein